VLRIGNHFTWPVQHFEGFDSLSFGTTCATVLLQASTSRIGTCRYSVASLTEKSVLRKDHRSLRRSTSSRPYLRPATHEAQSTSGCRHVSTCQQGEVLKYGPAARGGDAGQTVARRMTLTFASLAARQDASCRAWPRTRSRTGQPDMDAVRPTVRNDKSRQQHRTERQTDGTTDGLVRVGKNIGSRPVLSQAQWHKHANPARSHALP